MKIGIVGSRNFPYLGIVVDFVRALPKGTIIVSGGARGVDQTAAATARDIGLEVEEFLPDWNEHGNRAGIERNAQIVDASAKIVAFWDGASHGAEDTIEKARKAGVPVTIVNPDGSRYEVRPTNEDAFDNDDQQHGATKSEYEAMRARDEAEDYTPPQISEEKDPQEEDAEVDASPRTTKRDTTKVKLLATSFKWICAPEPKERTFPSGYTVRYFTQRIITVRKNHVVLTYDSGTHPLPQGPGKGIVVDIYGRTKSDPIPNHDEDNTHTIFIRGAEVFITKRRDKSLAQYLAQKPQAKAPTKKPAPTPDQRARNRELYELRKKVAALYRELEYDDTRETELRAEIERQCLTLRRLEKEAAGGPPALEIDEKELRELVHDQLRDLAETSFERVDETDTDDDEDAADIFDCNDHDEESADEQRAIEPWADSSAPVGATVDSDCFICPSRIGASCIRVNAGQPCILN